MHRLPGRLVVHVAQAAQRLSHGVPETALRVSRLAILAQDHKQRQHQQTHAVLVLRVRLRRARRADRVQDALTSGVRKITYTYDLGACWEHEITLERTLEGDPGRDYPVCVEFKGGSPVEYWSDDEPEESRPFSLAKVNRRLAALSAKE